MGVGELALEGSTSTTPALASHSGRTLNFTEGDARPKVLVSHLQASSTCPAVTPCSILWAPARLASSASSLGSEWPERREARQVGKRPSLSLLWARWDIESVYLQTANPAGHKEVPKSPDFHLLSLFTQNASDPALMQDIFSWHLF